MSWVFDLDIELPGRVPDEEFARRLEAWFDLDVSERRGYDAGWYVRPRLNTIVSNANRYGSYEEHHWHDADEIVPAAPCAHCGAFVLAGWWLGHIDWHINLDCPTGWPKGWPKVEPEPVLVNEPGFRSAHVAITVENPPEIDVEAAAAAIHIMRQRGQL